MKKVNMLKKNKDFSYCYRRGKKLSNAYFTLYYTCSKFNKRAGFSVSKKVGNSVCRNKIRRRFKENFTVLLPNINKECSVIFVAKPEITKISYWQMQESMTLALKKANLI